MNVFATLNSIHDVNSILKAIRVNQIKFISSEMKSSESDTIEIIISCRQEADLYEYMKPLLRYCETQVANELDIE